MAEWAAYLLIIQGWFYLVTGVWPILHMPSFEAVTGPKTDDWLVKTVGALIAVVALVLLVAGYRGGVPVEVALLAAASALALLAVDLIYVGKRTLSPVYLLDAAAEIGILAAWAVAWLSRS